MNYRIITDSCCDFTNQQYQELALACAPLSVLFKGEVLDNLNDPADLKVFYDGMRGGEMPTTSAVNPEGWVRIMKPILEAGEDILCLAFSSALSTTYQSAVIAANELMETYPERTIRVVDTLCAACGQGLLVWHAAHKRIEGMSLDALTEWVEEHKLNVSHWITVDDLNHLKRGGRLSATTAFFGGLLGIKPIIRVDDAGKLDTVGKVRGRKASMEYVAKQMGDTAIDLDTVFIGHGDCLEDAKTLEKILKEQYGVKNVIIGYVGGVIGAHTGPGVLVACFMASKR